MTAAWLRAALLWLWLTHVTQAQEPHQRAEPWSPHALVEAVVIDAETREPITDYQVLAATGFSSYRGWSWQPHTIYKPQAHLLHWPRGDKQGYAQQVLRVEAPGYVPYVSVPIARSDANREPHENALIVARGKPIRLEFLLQPDPGLRGAVITPAGEPAAGAQLAIAMNRRNVWIDERGLHWSEPSGSSPRDLWEQPQNTTADEHGRFLLPSESTLSELVVAHPTGFYATRVADFPAHGRLVLEPWSSVKGRVVLSGMPLAAAKVQLTARTHLISDLVRMRAFAMTDENGAFEAEGLPPGHLNYTCAAWRNEQGELVHNFAQHPQQQAKLAPGEVNEITLGGAGRPVTGKLVGPVDFSIVSLRMSLPTPHMRAGAEFHEAFQRFINSPQGRAYHRSGLPVNHDGTFRIEGVPSESYRLRVECLSEKGRSSRIGFKSFRVDSMPGGRSDEPLDLGEVRVTDQGCLPNKIARADQSVRGKQAAALAAPRGSKYDSYR